jgi:hypothetical protein
MAEHNSIGFVVLDFILEALAGIALTLLFSVGTF